VKGATADIRLINTLQEKIELLSWKKVDHLVIVPFTEAFSQLSAEQYVKEFLLEKFHPHTIIIGYDHQFGKGRKGDYHLLEDFSRRERFELQEINVHLLNEVSVSSTRIREAIGQADIATANRLLGYDFFFSGRVIEGNKLGRTIGYPTANLQVDDTEKLIPGDGVYAVEIAEETTPLDAPRPMKGMMNIGVRPTVDGTRRVIEVNIFDFDGDLYGKTLRIFIKKHLRGEVKFAGLDALKQQLAKDRENALAVLG
jgi:riboflavin kinase/FMN adenylyltransferase